MHRLIRFFRFISIGLFLVVLLYAYASLPDNVFVYMEGELPFQITKGNFFYLAIVVFFAVNVLISVIVFLIKGYLINDITEKIIDWLTGLSGFLNLFFASSIVALLAINSGSSKIISMPIFYGSVALVIIWLLSLVVIFKKAAAKDMEMAND
jgi:hypothetical protein